MIDPSTVLIKIRSVPETRADLVANQVELTCFTRYAFRNIMIIDTS